MPHYSFRDVAPVGEWSPEAQFTITGKQYEFLYNYFNMMQNLPWMMNDLHTKALQEGIIKTRYLYPDGTEATEEDVRLYQMQMAMMQKQIAGSKPGNSQQMLQDHSETENK